VGRLAVLTTLLVAGCGGALQTGPLRSVERITAPTPDDALPWIVALHGRGGSAATFARAFERLPVPARVVLLDAPITEAPGRAWFTWDWGAVGAGEQVRALVPRIERVIDDIRAAHPGAPRPIVTGFSQGGMLAYALVARRPWLFAGAVPVSARLLPHVLPLHVDAARAPPVHALHGSGDDVVSVESDRQSIDALRARGVRADLEVVGGATHHLEGGLLARFRAEVVAMLQRTD
jgi:phospholipase/carboxylesterase